MTRGAQCFAEQAWILSDLSTDLLKDLVKKDIAILEAGAEASRDACWSETSSGRSSRQVPRGRICRCRPANMPADAPIAQIIPASPVGNKLAQCIATHSHLH
jgi:hypothetical protein